jgi:hypothetical protein
MFDNSMTGAVGFAMHKDRLAMATENLRLIEAEEGSAPVRQSSAKAYRAVVAKLLIALAARIAPAVAAPVSNTHALAR